MGKKRKVQKGPSLRLQSTAYHEAGHHAMKWEFGFSLGKVTIKPDLENNLLGSSAHHHPPLKIETIKNLWEIDLPTPSQTDRIEKMIMVFLAGRVAERIFRPKKKGLCGASSDYDKAGKLLKLLVDYASRQYPVYWNLLFIRTQEFLSNPYTWTIVEGLTQALLERETLTGKEAKQVILEAIQKKIVSR